MFWDNDPVVGQTPSAQPSTAPFWANDPIAPNQPQTETTEPFKSGQKSALGDTLNGLQASITRGMTMGLTDQVRGLAAGTSDALKGGSFNQGYERGKQEASDESDKFLAEHPALARGGWALGALTSLSPKVTVGNGAITSAAPAIAPTLAGKAVQGAKVGAGIGTLAGVGQSDLTNPSDVAEKAASGGILGGATGGVVPVVAEKLIQPITEFGGRLIDPWLNAANGRLNPNASITPATQRQAAQRISSQMVSDEAAGGPSASQVSQAVNSAQPGGMIVNEAGENTKGLAGQVLRQPGPGRQFAISQLQAQGQDAPGHLTSTINAALTSPQSAYKATQDLIDKRSQDAAPAYQQAFQNSGPVDTNSIVSSLDNRIQTAKGSIKSALQKARDLFDDSSGNLDTSLQGLHETKISLDDLINNRADSSVGNTARRELVGVKQNLLNAMDTASNGQYANARNLFAGPSSAMDAVEQGQKFHLMGPEELADTLKNMSPSEQEFFKVGAADRLRTQLAEGKNLPNQIEKNNVLQNQINTIFGSNDITNQASTLAGRQADVRNLAGGSPTAGRVAQDNSEKTNSEWGRAALSLGTGEYVNAGLSGLKALASHITGPSPQVAAEISRMLYSRDPQTQRQALALIMAGKQSSPSAALGPLSRVGGTLGSYLPNLVNGPQSIQ